MQTPQPGLILAATTPVGSLEVDTPGPGRAPVRLWDEPIAGAVRQRGDDTAARSRAVDQMGSTSPPTLDELRRLAPVLQSITAAHGGLGLQVFGSVAHGSARPGSDLDLLVEFPASPSFEQVMDLKLALEDLLSA